MTRDHRRLAAIVATDVVGYSLLMGRDESGTLARLKRYQRDLVDPKIAEYDGRIVKTTGDGLLLEFPSVVDAVRCAVDVQRGAAELNASVPVDERIQYRIGINVGDIIIDGDDIFGDGVNVAARLQTLADPGGICVSRAVRDQVLDKLNFAFDDLGAREVKNIVRPVEVYRVALDPAASTPVVGRHHASRTAVAARSPLRWIIAAIALVALGTSAWMATRHIGEPSPIAPYSIEDRRMTFAVLPLQSPAGDAAAAAVATGMREAVTASQEARSRWAQVAPRRNVDEALAKHAGAKDVATALNVHFLIRGNVVPTSSGHSAELQVVDAATERVIGAHTLAIPAGATLPRSGDELDSALGMLTYQALQTEVQRARAKPDSDLDVRDLAFRAFVDWGKTRQQDGEAAYATATRLLNRALAQAPDDELAISLVAQINLCDCVEGWSKNIAVQQEQGAAALDTWLRRNPKSISALMLKSQLQALKGQYEESIVIADTVLRRQPQNSEALSTKAYDFVRLERPNEALDALTSVLERVDDVDTNAIAAAAYYQLARYDAAAEKAQRSIAQMNSEELRNAKKGPVALTLVAAEAQLGHASRAKAALARFREAAPGLDTLAGIKGWMHPTAELADYAPLFDGLRKAGIRD